MPLLCYVIPRDLNPTGITKSLGISKAITSQSLSIIFRTLLSRHDRVVGIFVPILSLFSGGWTFVNKDGCPWEVRNKQSLLVSPAYFIDRILSLENKSGKLRQNWGDSLLENIDATVQERNTAEFTELATKGVRKRSYQNIQCVAG